MSRRKVQYAKRNCIDPEEEGEELPFEPRDVQIDNTRWVTELYSFHEILGRGKFGEVKKCREHSTSLVLAAKIIAVHSESEKKAVKQEIEIQSELRHPKVLQIYDAFQRDKQMCIIMELIEGGELFDRVVDPKFDLTERVAILFMRQIVDAMEFIHSQNVLHLDMKPENIVCVAKTGTRIKLIDFGLAVRYDPRRAQQIMAGTIDFMAPEVANFEDVTPATDMWSVGVICYVLVSGLSPFQGDDDNQTISDILRVEYDFAAEEFEAITAGCKDFIKKLLIRDPRKRMTAKECMKHSWLQKITRAQTNRHLSKVHHVKFFVRRKWHKAFTAVKAINRLEKMSTRYMNRKLSAANGQPAHRTVAHHKPESAPKRNKPEPAVNHRKPEPTPHRSQPEPVVEKPDYDWKSNMEARRRQRNVDREKSPAVSSDNPAHNVAPSRPEQCKVDRNHLRPQLDNVNNWSNVRDRPRPAGRMDRLTAFDRDSPAENRSTARNKPEPTPARRNVAGRSNIRDRMSRFAEKPAETQADSKPPPSRQGRLSAIATGR